jgi:hypothetical protein
MKTVHRLFWTGLAVFLLSFLVGVFNISSTSADNAWSTIGLIGMLCGGALFGLCTVVIENDDGEESKAMHAARCLHCAQGLNTEISHLLESAKAASALAQEKASQVNIRALEQCLAVTNDLSDDELQELAASYPGLLLQNKREQEQVGNLLQELASYSRQCAALLAVCQEVEAITRPTFVATGRWRTGPEVAGQYILASEVEPQQVTVVLARSLKITANQIELALCQLRAAQEIAPRHLDGLSRFLSQPSPQPFPQPITQEKRTNTMSTNDTTKNAGDKTKTGGCKCGGKCGKAAKDCTCGAKKLPATPKPATLPSDTSKK